MKSPMRADGFRALVRDIGSNIDGVGAQGCDWTSIIYISDSTRIKDEFSE